MMKTARTSAVSCTSSPVGCVWGRRCLLVLLWFSATSLDAGTIGYWRMESPLAVDGAPIVAVTNTATDTNLTCVAATNAPCYSTNVAAASIYDPVSEVVRTNQFSLHATNGLGSVWAPNTNTFNTDDFTIEFFICLKYEPDAYHSFVRRAEIPVTHGWGIDFSHGTGTDRFGRARSRIDTPEQGNQVARGTRIYVDYGPPGPTGNSDLALDGDGTNDVPAWRHIAMVYDADGADTQATVTVWVDQVAGEPLVINGAFSHPDAILVIGNGDSDSPDVYLDEVRYSGTALGKDQFLRVHIPAGARITSPPGGWPLLPRDGSAEIRAGWREPGKAVYQQVSVTNMLFTNALRIAITGLCDSVNGVQAIADSYGEVQAGDVMLVSVFARAHPDIEGQTNAKATVYLQENGGSWGRAPALVVQPGPEWQQFVKPVSCPLALTNGEHNVAIDLAYDEQVIELGGLTIINYRDAFTVQQLPRTSVTYDGQAEAAPWRAPAQARIEQVRKGDITLNVVDCYGVPLTNVPTQLRMTDHTFQFGTATEARSLATTWDEYEALSGAARGSCTTNDLALLRETISAHFNKVVFGNDLKWGPWVLAKSDTNDTYRISWLDRAFAWCALENMEVRGHWVSYGPINGNSPFLLGYGPTNDLDQRILEHVNEIVPAVGSRVGEWDVINHIIGWGDATLLTRYGTNLYSQIIATTRLNNASCELWVNEGFTLSSGTHTDPYEQVIQDLLDVGTQPDGIGFMGHFQEDCLTPISTIYDRLDQFAALIPNLQITEFDVNTADEELQADYFRDVMTIAFSHTNMQAIVHWGFWEGMHWRPDAALWREDWSLKPAGEAYLDLLYDEWWTDEAHVSGTNGQVQSRGFLGTYNVITVYGGVTTTNAVVIPAAGTSVTVVADGDYDQDGMTDMTDLDDDNDRMPDADELEAGTDPRNSDSSLKLVMTVSALQNGDFQFEAVTGRVYDLEMSTNLLEVMWTPCLPHTNLTGNGIRQLQFTDTNQAEHLFFRLRLK